MSGWPFRFVHASDFHLELPLFGVSEVPPHLREAFVEAPYQAARRVFDVVLAEEAEFLVLSGDLLSPPDAGPRGVLFLLEQFERLAERDIPVYWAGGRIDQPEAWPTATPLPENVFVFPQGQVAETFHERDGEPLVRLLGTSRGKRSKILASDFDGFAKQGELFSLAVVHGHCEAASLSRHPINYWALGSEHDRATLFSTPHAAHYPGSPQGREPEEVGAHGCSLVQVDDRGKVRATLVPTDSLRWCRQELEVEVFWDQDELLDRMTERLKDLLDTVEDVTQLIEWKLVGEGPLVREMSVGRSTELLLEELRSRFDDAKSTAWSVSIHAEVTAKLPQTWHEEETMLGEFLRNVNHMRTDGAESLDLDSVVPTRYAGTEILGDRSLRDASTRSLLLNQAALLGSELLGSEPPSESLSAGQS